MTKSAPEYLDSVELHLLTGFARARAQAAWLLDKNVPHRVDGRRVIGPACMSRLGWKGATS